MPWISVPNQSDFKQVQSCSVGREADRTSRTCSVQLRTSEGVVLQFKWEDWQWKCSLTGKWMVKAPSIITVAFFPVAKWCCDHRSSLVLWPQSLSLNKHWIFLTHFYVSFYCLLSFSSESTLSVSFHPLLSSLIPANFISSLSPLGSSSVPDWDLSRSVFVSLSGIYLSCKQLLIFCSRCDETTSLIMKTMVTAGIHSLKAQSWWKSSPLYNNCWGCLPEVFAPENQMFLWSLSEKHSKQSSLILMWRREIYYLLPL